MNNQWLVPQSLSGSWGSILPIISLCVKQNVKTHSTSMSHISRQHSQRYGWHPACLPSSPNHTLFWAMIKPHTSISGEVWAVWDMIIQYQLCRSRHEKRKQEKQKERGEKNNLSYDSHLSLLLWWLWFGLQIICDLLLSKWLLKHKDTRKVHYLLSSQLALCYFEATLTP